MARRDRCCDPRSKEHIVRSNASWLEYEDVLARPIWTDETSKEDRVQVLAALVAAGRWAKIYNGWRPNLPDPGDDYRIELAVAGGARVVISHNVHDLRRAELRWRSCVVSTPSECLEEFP